MLCQYPGHLLCHDAGCRNSYLLPRTIYYKKGSTTFYTSTLTYSGELIGDVALYNTNATLKDVVMSTNKVSAVLTKNTYNEIGELINKKLHYTDQTTYEQSVDFNYNIRGWLTNINSSDLELQTGDPVDFFGMELAYNSDLGISGNNQLYNGNISAVKWSAALPDDLTAERAYKYDYDNLNRITKASYRINSTSWSSDNYAYDLDTIEYDYNGNIQKLVRNDENGLELDNLEYKYEAWDNRGNKLRSIDDDGNTNEGFIDGNTSGDDYYYDKNGNLRMDLNKGISKIKYNHISFWSKIKDTSVITFLELVIHQ